MDKQKIIPPVRLTSICTVWAALSIYVLRLIAKRTGVYLGYQATSGEGILAYYAAIVFAVGGSLILIASIYFLNRSSKAPTPDWLFGALAILVPLAILWLSPPIPLPS